MSRYPDDAVVDVLATVRQVEGDETVLGNPETAVFLVLPNEAVEILDDLAAGQTVGEARVSYQERHGEAPDMGDLLSFLEAKGLVRVREAGGDEDPGAPVAAVALRPKVRYHFENIPQALAARLFSLPVVIGCGSLIAVGLVLLLLDPSLLPGWRAFYFPENLTLSTLGVMGLYYLAIFVHEMAHLLAARAVGVSSRMGIGHRLWTLVAETDLTGLWGIPKQRRYLPLLAGPLVDATSASILLCVLFAHRQDWVSLSAGALAFSRALLLIYLLLLLWQCFFFVRTDFYYALASLFNCRNLLGDTEVFLRNQVARLFPGWRRFPHVDQSHLPAHERKAVRGYAVIWVLGRLGALSALLFIHIPLLINYFRLVSTTLAAGFQLDAYAYVDSVLVSTLAVLPVAAGLFLWGRSLTRAWVRQSP